MAEKFGKRASKHIKLSMFKGLGKIDLDKAGEAGLKKAIDAAGPKTVEAVLNAGTVKSAHSGFEKAAMDKILNDPKINQMIAAGNRLKKK